MRAFDIIYRIYDSHFQYTTLIKKEKGDRMGRKQACATKFDILVIYRTDANGTSTQRKIPERKRLRM